MAGARGGSRSAAWLVTPVCTSASPQAASNHTNFQPYTRGLKQFDDIHYTATGAYKESYCSITMHFGCFPSTGHISEVVLKDNFFAIVMGQHSYYQHWSSRNWSTGRSCKLLKLPVLSEGGKGPDSPGLHSHPGLRPRSLRPQPPRAGTRRLGSREERQPRLPAAGTRSRAHAPPACGPATPRARVTAAGPRQRRARSGSRSLRRKRQRRRAGAAAKARGRPRAPAPAPPALTPAPGGGGRVESPRPELPSAARLSCPARPAAVPSLPAPYPSERARDASPALHVRGPRPHRRRKDSGHAQARWGGVTGGAGTAARRGPLAEAAARCSAEGGARGRGLRGRGGDMQMRLWKRQVALTRCCNWPRPQANSVTHLSQLYTSDSYRVSFPQASGSSVSTLPLAFTCWQVICW